MHMKEDYSKSPVCQNSGAGKKGEMLESCQQCQQRGKT